MRRDLGRVVSVVQTGHVVVKPVDAALIKNLKLGFKVYDKNSDREIGWVSDVIGNIKNPYIVVRVSDKQVLESVAEGAYLQVEIPPPPKPRRKGRRRVKGGKEKPRPPRGRKSRERPGGKSGGKRRKGR